MTILNVSLLLLLGADHICSLTNIRHFDGYMKTIFYLGFYCASLPLTFPLEDVWLYNLTWERLLKIVVVLFQRVFHPLMKRMCLLTSPVMLHVLIAQHSALSCIWTTELQYVNKKCCYLKI